MSTTQQQQESAVCPGQRVGHVEDYHAGQGTYVRKQYIYSSVVGYKEISQQSDKPIISILKEKEPSIVPEIHSVVTARVTKVNPRYASLAIFCVGSKMLKEPYVGIIRSYRNTVAADDRLLQYCDTISNTISNTILVDGLTVTRTQDVRSTEIDKVEIYKCFRPGDIIKAEVISLGDSRSYFLSTAKNELGVIFATSVAGATMIPISWELMQCPKTKMKEFRKVAKVT